MDPTEAACRGLLPNYQIVPRSLPWSDLLPESRKCQPQGGLFAGQKRPACTLRSTPHLAAQAWAETLPPSARWGSVGLGMSPTIETLAGFWVLASSSVE